MPRATSLVAGDLSRDGVRVSVEQNVIDFFKWGFVDAGNWVEVAPKTPGVTDPYDASACYPLQKDGVADGRVWQAQRTDWCYEAGLDGGVDPAPASGVYVDGTFYPTAGTAGPYAHHLDYANGRVVFDAAVATAAMVQCAYSYRVVSLYDSDVPWFRPVVLDAFLTEEANQDRGGVLAVLNDYRVQTPLVVVEAAMAQGRRPLQLGSDAHWVDQAVLFHVVTEDKLVRDNIVDAISAQHEVAFPLYDVNLRRSRGDFPLDWRGSPVPGARQYPQLVADFPANVGFFSKVEPQDVSLQLPLFRGTVRAVLTTDTTGWSRAAAPRGRFGNVKYAALRLGG